VQAVESRAARGIGAADTVIGQPHDHLLSVRLDADASLRRCGVPRDVREGLGDEALIERLGLSGEMLPPPTAAGAIAGGVYRSASRETGLAQALPTDGVILRGQQPARREGGEASPRHHGDG
jgi:hypothetical protein